jgi:phospholipid transport system substrate-binding protein
VISSKAADGIAVGPTRRRIAGLAVALSFGLALAGIGTAARADDQAPDALVKSISNQVLDTIRGDKSLQTGDPNKLESLIDSKVMPYVDFEKMTQLAVGRGWRSATPEQKQQLQQQFRTLLVRTYAGAMAQVRDHRVEMKPLRAAPTDTDLVVHSQIVSNNTDPIPLDYHMEKTPDGWKIYDVNVLGVWLVETYRTQFRSQIDQSGVDGLIKSLQERNAANAK